VSERRCGRRARCGRRQLGGHEHESEAGAAAFGFLDVHSTSVIFGDLPDNCEAEPGSRPAARCFRAVEAVEDERPIGGRDAGAVVADDYFAPSDRQVDAAGAVAPLGGVLDEVPDRPRYRGSFTRVDIAGWRRE
jgi:hypothetical protein